MKENFQRRHSQLESSSKQRAYGTQYQPSVCAIQWEARPGHLIEMEHPASGEAHSGTLLGWRGSSVGECLPSMHKALG